MMANTISRRCDCTIFRYTNSFNDCTELNVRNVGKKNPEAQIQIEVEQKPSLGRRRLFSISIPESLTKEFIAACSIPDTDLPIP